MLDPVMLQNGNFLVFVYGTLLSGCSNHHMLGVSKFRSKYAIAGFRMVNVNGFYPAIYRDSSSPYTIHGEVYECTPATLEKLDALEGYYKTRPDLSYYRRDLLDFDVFDGTGPEQHWVYPFVYLWKDSGGYPEIPSGSWKER